MVAPPQIITQKQKKKAAKKLKKLKAKLEVKPPNMSANPQRRVAKNTVAVARMTNGQIAKQIEKIIVSVSAPREFPGVRLGTTFGSYQTAVANPFRVVVNGWRSTDNTSNGFIFRDPYRFFIGTAPQNSQGSYYSSLANNPMSVANTALPVAWGPAVATGGSNFVHGQALFPGRYGKQQRSFFWVQAGQSIILTNPTAAALSWIPYFVLPSGEQQVSAAVAAAPGVAVTYNPPFDAYWGFDVAATTNTNYNGSMSISIPPGNNWIAHRSIPFLNQNLPSADAIKLYGLSMMWTNEASPLNRQGKLTAVQIPQGRDWRDFTTYSSISSVKDAYVHDAVNGYYGFLKPTQPHDIDFLENNIIENGVVLAAWWDMSVPSDFLAMAVTVTDLNGQDGYFTYSAAFEYRTSDQWREVDAPKITADTVLKAMTLISRLPQHHENPFHLSDIFDWVKNAVGEVWGGIKSALPVVADVAGKTAMIATAIAPFL